MYMISPQIMQNQMEKNMQNEMATGTIQGLTGSGFDRSLFWDPTRRVLILWELSCVSLCKDRNPKPRDSGIFRMQAFASEFSRLHDQSTCAQHTLDIADTTAYLPEVA